MSLQPPADYFRYCPGEESIKLSNAICRGRRRTNYPKCKGCQFNDDERDRVVPASRDSAQPDKRSSDAAKLATSKSKDDAAPPSRDLAGLFRSTDIRGLCPLPLTNDAAWRIGYSAAQFMHSKLKGFDRAHPHAKSLVTACDARSASAAVHTAMTLGVRAAGMTVHDIGVVDTPQLYFAVRRLEACGGIMTTGGRSPVAYSGFKLCGAGGRDLAASTGLIDIRDIAGRVPSHQTGALAERHEVDLTDAYCAFVRTHLPPEGAESRPIRLVVDASDGVAGRWVRSVLTDMPGIHLQLIHDAGDEPFAHEPDPSDPANLSDLRRTVRQESADMGVCFDGDGDGCAFVDERGALIWPDTMAILIGRHLLERAGGGAVVIDQRFGPMTGETLEKAGGTVRRERGASHHIRKAMIECGALFGASLSGQYFFAEAGASESGLVALATVLRLMCAEERRLSEGVRTLQPYRAMTERRMNMASTGAMFAALAETDEASPQRIGDGVILRHAEGWTCLYPGDEPHTLLIRAAASTQVELKQQMSRLQARLASFVT